MVELDIWDKKINIDLSYKDKYFIGINGSGKTMLLHSIANYFDSVNIDYINYDAMTALYDFDFYESITIAEEELFLSFLNKIVDSKDILYGITQNMSKSSFRLYEVLGHGHLRLLNMLIKAVRTDAPTFFLLDLPETSIHIHVLNRLLEYIKSANPFLTCLIATHSPDIISNTKMRNSIVHMHELLE